jgi:hypothetical protein
VEARFAHPVHHSMFWLYFSLCVDAEGSRAADRTFSEVRPREVSLFVFVFTFFTPKTFKGTQVSSGGQPYHL